MLYSTLSLEVIPTTSLPITPSLLSKPLTWSIGCHNAVYESELNYIHHQSSFILFIRYVGRD